MKNIIKELYNINVDRIYNHYFFYKDEKILIIEFDKDDKKIGELVKITNYLYQNKIKVNTFLKNKNESFYFLKNEKYYSLLKINDREIKINEKDLIKIIVKEGIDEYNIISEIEENIQKIEEKHNDYEIKYMKECLNYYLGLSENSLILLNEYKENNNFLNHKTRMIKYNKEEFYNPKNFIKTNYTYDLSNYIKYNFFTNEIDYDNIYNMLVKIDDENDQIFLYSMLLYPNYFFESIEEMNENYIKFYIKKIDKYEEMLSFVKNIYKKNQYIQKINWLK